MDGTYGTPIAAKKTRGGSDYGANKLNAVFNVNGDPTSLSTDHWCAFDKSEITITFAEPQSFVSYKFAAHSSECINDPQAWKIFAQNDGDSAWVELGSQEQECPLPDLEGWGNVYVTPSLARRCR